AQHLPNRGTIQVRIEPALGEPAAGEGPREVRGDRALADAPLAGDDRHGGADGGHPGGEPRLLGADLLDDVGTAVARDVAIALHVPVPSSLVSRGAAGGSRRCARKRRMRSSPRKSPDWPWRSASK